MPKEYIEREAAITAMTADNLLEHFDSVEDIIENRFHRAAERILASIPAADVVEVVRCTECVYNCGETTDIIGRRMIICATGDTRPTDYFCKWGKRKEGGQDE